MGLGKAKRLANTRQEEDIGEKSRFLALPSMRTQHPMLRKSRLVVTDPCLLALQGPWVSDFVVIVVVLMFSKTKS